jgi:sperm-associated antigen 16 protein
MLMKLEKDRLIAKVDSLQISLNQIIDEKHVDVGKPSTKKESPEKSGPFKTTGMLTPIPHGNRYNPHEAEVYEPSSSSLGLVKPIKGHLAGVSCVSYNPKKDIIATGSDDSTWKLWSVPTGDLIMSGEGHIDWIGGLDFHPKGHLLASASGDGNVKIWDFATAGCAHTFTEHG